jgi:CelD/BcsL family acetyltransferase involved in cellulose biosynthesis
MAIRVLDPLYDPSWDRFVERHPRASVFHDRGWLEALALTYRYKPLVITNTPQCRPLSNCIVLCRVSSWLTGTRLVSLPFADHCEPLLSEGDDFSEFLTWLQVQRDRKGWKYVELRPLSGNLEGQELLRSVSYYFHTLDLNQNIDQLFRNCHKTSVQQMVRRAEKTGLVCEAGRSEQLCSEFYGLLLKTRRRHGIFPQPRFWFKNLLQCMGEKIQITVARQDGVPIAAILTLRHGSSVVYKYGCSDQKFHNLGGMQLLIWKLIEEAKTQGAKELDFGRSEMSNKGLVTFKDRFGTTKKLLTYLRYPEFKKPTQAIGWGQRAAQQVFSLLPDQISPMAGSILYRHIG